MNNTELLSTASVMSSSAYIANESKHSPCKTRIIAIACLIFAAIAIVNALVLGHVLIFPIPVAAVAVAITVSLIMITILVCKGCHRKDNYLTTEEPEIDEEQLFRKYFLEQSYAFEPIPNDILSDDEQLALHVWTGSFYKEMNAVAAGEPFTAGPGDTIVTDKLIINRIKRINQIAIQALKKLPPHPAVALERYATFDPTLLKNIYKENEIYILDRFMSTSTHSPMNDWDFNVLFRVNGLTGRDIDGYSCLPGEDEILFLPQTPFLVKSIVTQNIETQNRQNSTKTIYIVQLDEIDLFQNSLWLEK